MLNNKGQSLVLMIIIIPLLLLAFASIIEYSNVIYNKRHIVSVTKSILANCIDRCEKNDIMDLYSSNDINVSSLDIYKDNGLEIKASFKFKSIFKDIINKEDYTYNEDIKAVAENDKIVYEKGS